MDEGNELFQGISDSTHQRRARESDQRRESIVKFAFLLIFLGVLGIAIGSLAAFGGRLSGDPRDYFLNRFAFGVLGTLFGALLGFGIAFEIVVRREFRADIFGGKTADPAIAMVRGMILVAVGLGSGLASIAHDDRPLSWGTLIGGIAAGLFVSALGSIAGLIRIVEKNRSFKP